MTRLADYNPLSAIKFGGETIDNPSGLIVIVGPNSSGKSLLMRDIEQYLLTGNSGGIVCDAISVRPPTNTTAFLSDLISKRLVRHIIDGNGRTDKYEVNLPPLRSQDARLYARTSFSEKSLSQAIKDFNTQFGGNNPGFFAAVGLTLVGYLSFESRRSICQPANRFDHESQSPEMPLQGLMLDDNAINVIAKETGRVFDNAVWLDASNNGNLVLRTSGKPEVPTIGEMTNPIRARGLLALQSEGDGIQSYVGVCITTLLGLRPVILLDEPELCLHPPQAYQMGRFIGERSGKSQVTFVATHSSHLLRGILDTAKSVTVIRLTHQKPKFTARLIPNDLLRSTIRNPRSRAEATLDGMFSKSVIIVESDGDREVYQTACETAKGYPSNEIHFVCTGGTSGFKELCAFYTTLGVPVAVIADLDILADTNRLRDILTALNPDINLDERIAQLRATAQKIKALPASISEDVVKMELRSLADEDLSWERGDDNRVRSTLTKLAKKVYRVGRLKEGGVTAYTENLEIQKMLQVAIQKCSSLGVFLVPVGELEAWVPHLMTATPTHLTKTERAYEMAEAIRLASDKKGDVWEFTQSVLDYLDSVPVEGKPLPPHSDPSNKQGAPSPQAQN